MSRNEDKLVGFMAGLLVGGVLGSVLAMLYTPVSGKRMRREITHKTDNLIDDLNEYIDTSRKKAEDIIHEGRKKAENIISDAKKVVSN